MNRVTFGSDTFMIPNDGINYTERELNLVLYPILVPMNVLEQDLMGVGDRIDIYNEEGAVVTGTFIGYSQLASIAKEYDYKLDEQTTVDVYRVSLIKPNILEQMVAQNTEDIEIINGAIEELAEIIGGGE